MAILRCSNGTRGAARAAVVKVLAERTKCLGLPMLACRSCVTSACGMSVPLGISNNIVVDHKVSAGCSLAQIGA